MNFMGKLHNFVSQGGELHRVTRVMLMLSCSNKGFPSRDKVIVPLYLSRHTWNIVFSGPHYTKKNIWTDWRRSRKATKMMQHREQHREAAM